MKTLLLASALFATLLCCSAAIPIPYHAFCRTLWLTATPCAEISTRLVQQIQAYDIMNGCPECQFSLVSATGFTIQANHTSIDGLHSENITFTIKPTVLSKGCRMNGISVSHDFTSLIDDGLNYCNLYNLLSASGITTTPGFTEMTSEWACLGYGLATCK